MAVTQIPSSNASAAVKFWAPCPLGQIARQTMQFIETLFGLSPDNNSGATEVAIFLGLYLGLAAAWCAFERYRRAKQPSV